MEINKEERKRKEKKKRGKKYGVPDGFGCYGVLHHPYMQLSVYYTASTIQSISFLYDRPERRARKSEEN